MRRRLAASPVVRLTAGSALVGVVAQAILFVSGVLAARLLGPTDRGHLALLYLIPLVLTLVGGLGVPAALPYFISRDLASARRVVRRIAPLVVAQLAVIAALQVLILALAIEHRLPDAHLAVWLSVASVPGLLGQVYGNGILQGIHRLRLFSVMRLMPGGLYVLALLGLLITDSATLTTATAAWAGSMFAGGMVTLVVALVGIVGPHVAGIDTFVIQSAPDLAALFALGVLAGGIVIASERRRSLPWAWIALAAAVPVLATIAWQGSVWTLDRLFWVDLALGPAIACLLAALVTGHPARLLRFLDSRPIRNLGLASYSLYLIHGPIVVVVYEKVVAGRVGHGVPSFLLAVVLIVPLSIGSARAFAAVFEIPFQRHRGWPGLHL
ncbi:MAG TPA: hypothetical protein VGI54_11925, partial [Solirubrobacteraceae bacterium]